MSTEIGQVKARLEKSHGVFPYGEVVYSPQTIYVNTFYGGKKNGKMTQVTFCKGDSAQLTKDQTKDLIKHLKKSIDEE
jgi:uncharacterized pyridoxamine 5'-phosphate oxidase family protein